MIIAVAGPYSAETAEQRQKNLDKLNHYASEIYALGHIPVIGVHNALPIAELQPENLRYDCIMKISLEIVSRCDALFLVSESPGALRERDLIASMNKPIYHDLSEIVKP